jgi:hypothetical protein
VGIGRSKHVKVEGWTLLGSMLGVFPVCTWTRRIGDDGAADGWEARVEARTLGGQLVGAAEAQCTRSENLWSYAPTDRNGRQLDVREDYALRSMAQTRATAKALRLPLGFIVVLAGYEATPAEEMAADVVEGSGTFQVPERARREAASTSPASSGMGEELTEPQRRKIMAMLTKLQSLGMLTRAQLEEHTQSFYGAEPHHLKKREASAVIDWLTAIENGNATAETPAADTSTTTDADIPF